MLICVFGLFYVILRMSHNSRVAVLAQQHVQINQELFTAY